MRSNPGFGKCFSVQELITRVKWWSQRSRKLSNLTSLHRHQKGPQSKKGETTSVRDWTNCGPKNISRLNQQFRPKKERKAYWKEILAPRDSADARFCRTRINRVIGPCLIGFLVFRPFKILPNYCSGNFCQGEFSLYRNLNCKNIQCRLLFQISLLLCAAKIFKESQ